MNPHAIKRLFPNASLSTLAANAQDYGSDAAIESTLRPKPLAESKAKETNPERFLVRLTSVRKRLGDEDNICGKFHVDALRYAGIIPDDCPDICSIRTTQRKCEKGEEEHTLIEVYQL